MKTFLTHTLLTDWPVGLGSVVIVLLAGLVALFSHAALAALTRRLIRHTGTSLDDRIVDRLYKPTRFILVLMALLLVLPGTAMPAAGLVIFRRLCAVGLIAVTAWGIIALIGAINDFVLATYRLDVSDNLLARRIHTRFHMLRRIAAVVISLLAGSAILMTFPSLRHFGTSLLASAGLTGLVIGMAARPALSNLIAGVQLALSEPIRIDDVVIIEGEWGWVEEINTTYVVVRVWDLRRLIIPLSYFIETPFQNWTRVSADLLGTVYLYADYTVPVEEVRQTLLAILKASGMWDGKVWGLQVTNASEHTVELRALMSARDSGTAWNLRCHVREKLIAALQQHYPTCLPKVRAELHRAEPQDGQQTP